MSIPTKLTRADAMPMIIDAFGAAIRDYRDGVSGVGVYLSSNGTIETGSDSQPDFVEMILSGDAYNIADSDDLNDDQVMAMATEQLQSDAAEVYRYYSVAYDDYFLADVMGAVEVAEQETISLDGGTTYVSPDTLDDDQIEVVYNAIQGAVGDAPITYDTVHLSSDPSDWDNETPQQLRRAYVMLAGAYGRISMRGYELYLDDVLRAALDGRESVFSGRQYNMVDLYDYSGLTRAAWIQALDIADNTWAKIRAGMTEPSDNVYRAAVSAALTARAVYTRQLHVTDLRALCQLRKAIAPR